MLKNIFLKIAIIIAASAGAAAIVNYFFKLSPFIIIGIIIACGLVLKILKNPVFGVFVVAFLLPFERIGSFDLGGITIRPSQVFALITLISWFLSFIKYPQNFKAKNPLIIPISLFLGFSILSFINSPNYTRSISVFLFNIFVIIISLMLPNLIKSEKTFTIIFKILFFVTLVVSIFGFYQFIGDIIGLPDSLTGLREIYTKKVFGFPRIQSTALEPLYFANFLLIPISFAFSFLLSRNYKSRTFLGDIKPQRKNLFNIHSSSQQAAVHSGKVRDKKILGNLKNIFFVVIILGAAVINLVLTLSRGAFIAFGALLAMLFLVYFKSFFSLKRIIMIGLISAIAFVSVLSFLKFTGKEKNIGIFLKQATNLSKGVAIKERSNTAFIAQKMIEDHPFIGFGPGSFGPYAATSSHVQPKEGWLIANNIFLEVWAEEGFFGLIAFVIIIIIIIVRTLKAWQIANQKSLFYPKAALLGGFLAFLAILVQYQTFSILYILHIWFLVGLIIAAQNWILNKQNA